jgi:hypothetical protein
VFPVTLLPKTKGRSTYHQAYSTLHSLKIPLDLGFNNFVWISMEYANFVNYLYRPGWTVRDPLISSGTKPRVEQGRLVPYAVPCNLYKDVQLHIWHADAIGSSTSGQSWIVWTISRMFCRVLIVGPSFFQTAQRHLEDNQSYALSCKYGKIHR